MYTITEREYNRLLRATNLSETIEKAQHYLATERQRRQEFYDMITPSIKAEFIEGQVVMHSPATRNHGRFNKYLVKLADTYTSIRKLGEVLFEKALIELHRNSYEPNIAFWKKEKSDLFSGDQMIFPAPDWVVEILSKSTERIDRKTKMADYALNGISEYWIIDPNSQHVEQYALLVESDREYTYFGTFRIGQDIKSRAMEGFEIPVAAIFDEKINNETLQELLKS